MTYTKLYYIYIYIHIYICIHRPEQAMIISFQVGPQEGNLPFYLGRPQSKNTAIEFRKLFLDLPLLLLPQFVIIKERSLSYRMFPNFLCPLSPLTLRLQLNEPLREPSPIVLALVPILTLCRLGQIGLLSGIGSQ